MNVIFKGMTNEEANELYERTGICPDIDYEAMERKRQEFDAELAEKYKPEKNEELFKFWNLLNDRYPDRFHFLEEWIEFFISGDEIFDDLDLLKYIIENIPDTMYVEYHQTTSGTDSDDTFVYIIELVRE